MTVEMFEAFKILVAGYGLLTAIIQNIIAGDWTIPSDANWVTTATIRYSFKPRNTPKT